VFRCLFTRNTYSGVVVTLGVRVGCGVPGVAVGDGVIVLDGDGLGVIVSVGVGGGDGECEGVLTDIVAEGVAVDSKVLSGNSIVGAAPSMLVLMLLLHPVIAAIIEIAATNITIAFTILFAFINCLLMYSIVSLSQAQ